MVSKVLIISSVHFWNDARIFYKEAISLAKHYRVKLHAVGDFQGLNQGVEVDCLPGRKNRLARVINTVRLLIRGLKFRPDVLHFHDPELIPIALLIKIITGCRVIYDVHEDFPAAILSKFWIPAALRKPLAFVANLVEKNCSRFFDLLIFAEASYQEKFRQLKTRSVNIYNYPVRLYPEQTCPRLGEADIHLVYAGSLTKTRGAMNMLQALAQTDFKDKSFHFWILGPVRPAELLSEMQEFINAHEKLSGRVTFTGFVPLQTVYYYCSGAQIGFALLHPEPNYLRSLATKLFDYMSVGLPILASNFPDWAKLLAKTQCGLTVDPLDPQAIAWALEFLVHNPELRNAIGQNGRKAYAAGYNWTGQAEKLYAAYQELLEK
ncbi:MAG: glycosyltransferase family 4 protein [Carboxydocellales bacterium]